MVLRPLDAVLRSPFPGLELAAPKNSDPLTQELTSPHCTAGRAAALGLVGRD